jgi:hypothetical protein
VKEYDFVFEIPSDEVFMFTTVLQFLALIAAGLCVVQVSAASLVAQKALDLKEIPDRTQPFNRWKSGSHYFDLILPDVEIFWRPHIVWYYRNFPRAMESLNSISQLTWSSLDKGTASDSHLKSDSVWMKTFPRVLFCELYIIASFHTPHMVIENVDRCFQIIRQGTSGSRLGAMLCGAGSAYEMAKSALAIDGSQEAYVGGSGWQYLIDPRVSRFVTKETKKLLRGEVAAIVQATTPDPRFLRRIQSRDSNLIQAFDSVAYDEEGNLVDKETLRRDFSYAGKLLAIVNMIEPVLDQLFARIEKKVGSVVSSRKESDGSLAFVGSRGLGLHYVRDGKNWISAQVLSVGNVSLNPVEGKDPKISPLFDGHLLIRKDSTPENMLDDCAIVCRSSAKPGLFLPSTWEKASIQMELLKV